MMTDACSERLPKPSGVRDPQLGPRSNGSVLMMIGEHAVDIPVSETIGCRLLRCENSQLWVLKINSDCRFEPTTLRLPGVVP